MAGNSNPAWARVSPVLCYRQPFQGSQSATPPSLVVIFLGSLCSVNFFMEVKHEAALKRSVPWCWVGSHCATVTCVQGQYFQHPQEMPCPHEAVIPHFPKNRTFIFISPGVTHSRHFIQVQSYNMWPLYLDSPDYYIFSSLVCVVAQVIIWFFFMAV